MKKVLCALALLLAMTSVASAGWVYPTTVVQSYYPVGPVYAYPAPTVYMDRMPVVVDNVVAPPVPTWGVYGYPSYVVPAPYFVPGQPIRNRMRANRFW